MDVENPNPTDADDRPLWTFDRRGRLVSMEVVGTCERLVTATSDDTPQTISIQGSEGYEWGGQIDCSGSQRPSDRLACSVEASGVARHVPR